MTAFRVLQALDIDVGITPIDEPIRELLRATGAIGKDESC